MKSIRRSFKEFSKRLIQAILSLFGFKFHAHNLRGLFNYLKKNRIVIDKVLDIGAHEGTWSEQVRYFLPRANFTLIEPNKIHNQKIMRRGFTPINVALSDCDSEKTFFGNGQTGDSLYPELNLDDQTPNSRIEKTKSLDSLFKSHPEIPRPDFIKIDTQGSELDILKGGKEVFSQAKVILLELPVMPYNLGAPDFSECVNFMLQSSFIPIYLCEVHELRDCLVQVDIAFLNKEMFEKTFGSLSSRGFWNITLRRFPRLKIN